MKTNTLETAMENAAGSGPFPETSETIVYDVHLWDEHPMMSTSFSDYSVAEGLLSAPDLRPSAPGLLFKPFPEVALMLDIVYEFLGLTGLEAMPATLAELIPYLLKFIVAVVLVLAVFKMIAAITQIFCNWRWFK